jgi:CDP-glucose 4,6-dehydratase
VKSIVVASSDKAYGDQQDLPYAEDTPLEGRHPYDVSKSCADLIAQSYARSYGLPVGITRCGNFYGGGDLNWNRIVPGTIRSVLRGERPVVRSDGQYVRDYFYVEDGAAAYMLLAEELHSRSELHGQAFNFSNEGEVTVICLVKRILALMGSELAPVVLNQASNEIRRQFLSASRARTELSWAPLFNLEDGLERENSGSGGRVLRRSLSHTGVRSGGQQGAGFGQGLRCGGNVRAGGFGIGFLADHRTFRGPLRARIRPLV